MNLLWEDSEFKKYTQKIRNLKSNNFACCSLILNLSRTQIFKQGAFIRVLKRQDKAVEVYM